MKKKLISALILAVMLICLLPAAAFANYDIGDLLRGTYVCHECDNTVKVYLKGFEPEEAGGGIYSHAMYVECVNGHSISLSYYCFIEPFDDSFVTYDKLSAESSYDPAVYHKAICVCGNSTNKEHNYGEAVDGSRTCFDCGYVQTCDHTPLCEDFLCPVCGEVVKGSGHDTVLEHDFDNHWERCSKCGNIIGSTEAHKWDDGVITQDPTCMISGIKKFTCTVCGAADLQDVEGDHDYKDAHDAENHYQECSVCHNMINIEAHKFEWKIDRHATTTAEGEKHEECTVCGYAKESVSIPKLAADAKPQTGDSSAVWLVLLVMSGSASAAAMILTKRKKA